MISTVCKNDRLVVLLGWIAGMALGALAASDGAGLWQAKSNGWENGANRNWQLRPLSRNVGKGEWERSRQPGPMAAFAREWVSPFDGAKGWWTDVSTFGYVGYMYLDGGVEYVFESSCHDAVCIELDGECVHVVDEWQTNVQSRVSVFNGGWHPVKICVGCGVNNPNPVEGDAALRFSADGGATWTKLVDPGDGSLFRVRPGDVSMVSRDGSDEFFGSGLWEARSTGGQADWSLDVMARPDGAQSDARRFEPGPCAAWCQNDETWSPPGFPAQTNRWSQFETWGYAGEIFLVKGEWRFTTSIDDCCFIEIGGEEVVNSRPGKPREAADGRFTAARDGWYPLRLCVGNDAGNGGGRAKRDSIRFAPVGSDGWRTLDDGGSGGLLRAPLGVRLASLCRSGRKLSAVVDASACAPCVPRGAEVFFVPSSGERRAIGSVARGRLAFTTELEDDAARDVRFEIVEAGGKCLGRTDVMHLPAAGELALGAGATVDGREGDRLLVCGQLVGVGAGENANVRLQLSSRRDFSGADTIDLGSHAGGEFFTNVVRYLNMRKIHPGSYYRYRFVATGADGKVLETPIREVRTGAGARFSECTEGNVATWHGYFSGRLDEVGAGEGTVVSLLLGDDEDTLTNAVETVMRQAGEFRFHVEFPFVNRKVAWRFSAVNRASGGRWRTQSELLTVMPNDPASYTWRPGRSGGKWNDPENWESSVDDPRCRYPGATCGVISFLKADSNVKVELDEPVSGWKIEFSDKHDLEIVGDGAGEATMQFWQAPMEAKKGTTVTFRGVQVGHAGGMGVEEDATMRFLDGGNYESWPEFRLKGKNSVLEVRGGSMFSAGQGIRCEQPGAKVVIDEATVQLMFGAFRPACPVSELDRALVFEGEHAALIARGVECVGPQDGLKEKLEKLKSERRLYDP